VLPPCQGVAAKNQLLGALLLWTFFSWCCVKVQAFCTKVCKAHLCNISVIGSAIPRMLEGTSHETEWCSDISKSRKWSYVEVCYVYNCIRIFWDVIPNNMNRFLLPHVVFLGRFVTSGNNLWTCRRHILILCTDKFSILPWKWYKLHDHLVITAIQKVLGMFHLYYLSSKIYLGPIC
jgi:hypothetical protein